LDVVTYNIQMLTGLAAAGCHSPCLNDIRGPLIAQAPELHDRDVLVFVEAFDDVERNRLINRLKSEYPFYTTVLDGPGPLPGGVHYTNGGVFIMSKWPIVKEDQHIYDICHDIVGGTFDCWAPKGVKYARIRRTNRMWHVYATHTDAGDAPADAGTRAYQMKEMQFFISTTLPIQATHGDILLMAGDFNIDRNKPGQQEYYNMLSTLHAVDPSPGEPGGTNRDGNWIDYVLYGDWANLNRPSTSANRVMHIFDYSGQHYEYFAYPQLSDHHAVLGNFTVFRQDDLSGQAMSTEQSFSAASEASTLVSEPSAATPEECAVSVELSAPTALAPLGTIDRDVQTFRWSEVPGADAYRLEVIDTVTSTSVIDVVVPETVFTAKPPFAVSGRPYRWRVTPQRGSAAGPDSGDQLFTYDDTPIPAPLAVGPLGTVDGDYPTFSWSAVSSADAYHLVVVDVGSGEAVVDGLAPASSITAERPCVPGRQYRWKVSARRGSKDGPASQELSFTCTSVTGLAAPTAREPVGDIDTALPTFSWDRVEGGHLYQLDVFDVETSTLVLRARVAATAFTPPVPLTPGRAYRWMVKALKDDVVVETVPPPDAMGGPFSVILVFRPLPPNRAPSVAISGCHECVVPCRVTLNALASDPDGDLLSYSWSGCATGTASTATCTLETAGPTSATVTVTDGRGGTATASTTVDGRPWVVTVNATPACTSTGCTVTFEAAAAENPPGAPVAFSWSGCGSATGSVLTCQRSGSGPLAATVTVTSAGGATATAQAQVLVLSAQFSTGAWSACTGTGAWTCNAAGANGCQRSGSQTRSVTESAWTTNPAEAATAPPATQPCTETAPGYVATYSATYAANWTCTAGGANGCYKNRVSYSASTFSAAAPDAPVPAATLYTYGYVASWIQASGRDAARRPATGAAGTRARSGRRAGSPMRRMRLGHPMPWGAASRAATPATTMGCTRRGASAMTRAGSSATPAIVTTDRAAS
jgi:endonuclease/exonuclease/phosphatase family metal-dependent hydrolase